MIIAVDDDCDEITIKIGNTYIVGFVNSGITKKIGDEVEIEITLFDDLDIYKSDWNKISIERLGDSFSYSLYGILDVDNSILKSTIDFVINKEELYDYGYLDGEFVRVDVVRIDIY